MDAVERMRRMFDGGPVDRLPRYSFGFFPQTLERWQREGAPGDVIVDGKHGPRFSEFFGFDEPVWLAQAVNLGWCEAPLCPAYEEGVVREEDGHEVVRDFVGRLKLYPKGQRQQVMPTYLSHAVTSMDDWVNEVRPRLAPDTPARWDGYDEKLARHREILAAGEKLHSANVVGGYMYLRSLMGPEDLLLAFYDAPDLIRSMMATWRDVMVTCLRRVQSDVGPFFRLFLAEDICYKSGPLISPAMMREFLLPHYSELAQALRDGQDETLHFEIDTDGDCRPTIDVYRGIGVDAMSPFEVASGCDVVEIARQYPDLHMRGGIDKRVLAKGPAAIDEMVERIFPPMVRRGRFVPCCDHATPDDVSLANFLHYRRRAMEMDH